jgi:hypothetical protein
MAARLRFSALRANINETFLAARIREQGEKEMNHDRGSATRLAGPGSHPEEAQASGHKTRSILDRYSIVVEKDIHAAGRRMEAYLAEQDKVRTVEPETIPPGLLN